MSALARTIPATSLPSVGVLAAGAAAAIVVIAVLCALMRRHAGAFPLLAVLTLPFRVPISADGRTVNLLVPLYLVIAAGTLVHLLPRLLAGAGVGPAGRREALPSLHQPRSWLSPLGLELVLFAAVVLYALQAIYSSDRAKAAENIAFFYVPFALLFAILRDTRWTRELLAGCLAVAVTLAVLFAGVGFVEYYRKSLFLNPKVVAADQYANYFRVNSVFFDPSIYGRFLALVMIGVMTVVLVGRGSDAGPLAQERLRRQTLGGAAVLLWLLAGLVTSFSQSSIAALLLGLAVLGGWCWGVRPAAYLSAGLLVLALAFVLVAPSSLHFGLKGSGGSAANATSGRTTLIDGGLELFAERPLEGYGSGSFETEYKRHSHADAEDATSASHTIPITVAAEQGIVGLAMYAALLLVAFAVLFHGAGRAPPRPKPGDTRLRFASPARPAIAACFAALVLHTWTYADFLEDPFTWALLAVGIALARAGAGAVAAREGVGAPASSV